MGQQDSNQKEANELWCCVKASEQALVLVYLCHFARQARQNSQPWSQDTITAIKLICKGPHLPWQAWIQGVEGQQALSPQNGNIHPKMGISTPLPRGKKNPR